jgi:hypothetical protein
MKTRTALKAGETIASNDLGPVNIQKKHVAG